MGPATGSPADRAGTLRGLLLSSFAWSTIGRIAGISAIAMAHGFNDLSHFSRSFRQLFGMSPRAYRCDGGAGLFQ
jgi:AraC-like DNA-binding protein